MLTGLWQLAVVWSATCGTVLPTGDTTAAYTAPATLPASGRCVITATAGGKSGQSVATLTAAEVVDPGLAIGLSQWPADNYCAGPMTAALDPLAPSDVLSRVQLAARCGLRLFIVPPRRFLTATGKVSGLFVLDSAKRVTDRYALALPPDTLAKYRSTLLGLNLADDYSSTASWGGTAITPAQIAAWAAYASGKLPGLPLGVRVTPDWTMSYPILPPLLDYAWAQYHAGKGTQADYYARAMRDAAALRLKLVVGVAVSNCSGINTAPCTPAERVAYGTGAVTAGGCAVILWKYEPTLDTATEMRAANDTLARLAQAVPTMECRR